LQENILAFLITPQNNRCAIIFYTERSRAMTPNLRNHRKTGKRGYRLHDARIAYSGGIGSMRSIKYELKDPSGINGLRDQIAEAVASDNKWLYGNINLNDYLEWRASKTDQQITNGEREASFLGFWLRSLSLGFVFSKQSHAVFDFTVDERAKDTLFNRIPENLRNRINRDSWFQFYSARKDGKTGVVGVFNKDNRKDKDVKTLLDSYDSFKDNNNRAEERIKLFITDYQEQSEDDFPKYDSKNVSWHCYPDIELTEQDPTKLLDAIIKHYNGRYNLTENKKDDETSNRMGLYSLNQGLMYGVLSNFFQFVRKGEFTEYLMSVKNFFKYSDADTEKIKSKLDALSEYAKQIPEKPQTVTSWSKYVGDFGGKLESWYSNRAEKLKKIPEQISALYDLIEKIENTLKNQTDATEEKQLLAEIKAEIVDHRVLLDKPEEVVFSWRVVKEDKKTHEKTELDYFVKKLADRDFTERLELWLADLRSKLNYYNQQNKVAVTKKKKTEEVGILDNALNGADKDENGENKKGWQKKLSAKVQSAPLFFGESKRQLWEETYNLKSLITTETDKIKKILDKANDLDKIVIKYEEELSKDGSVKENGKKGSYYVNVLARTYSRYSENGFNGNTEVEQVLENIAKKIGVSFADYDNHSNNGARRFYLSGKERGRFKAVEWGGTVSAKEILDASGLLQLLDKVKTNFNQENLLRDVVQLSKTITAMALSSADKKEQIESNYTHSKLGGYISIISKRQFIARYQVQATGTDGNKNNAFAGGNQVTLGIGKGLSKKNNETNKYFYAFKDLASDENQKTHLDKICKAKDNTDNPNGKERDIVTTPENTRYTALQVYSSKYQIQFLDWFFGNQKDNRKDVAYNPHRSKKTNLKIAGAFTIVEKTVDIDWSGVNPTCKVENDNRIFVSQPFEIIPMSKPEFSDEKVKNRYVGVDIGEYGLAWSLVAVDDTQNPVKVTQLERGFIADIQQQVLKKEVKSWRENQVRQTFTSMDTKVARLRESLIGSYRNQLESLALVKNATLSFEYEVSGFEVGSNKVAKVYDSIKRSSVLKGKENKSENEQNWGKLSNHNWAKETTAAGTSQFCTKKHEGFPQWASLDLDENSDYKLEEYQDGLLKTKLDSGHYVRLFAPHGKAGDMVKGKDLKGMIYKAMRPNMFVDSEQKTIFGGMKIVEEKLGSEKFRELQKTFGAGKDRGNIGVYICPYIDCHHISDADLQAAFNIAVRGYLKSANPEKAKKPGDAGLSREFLTTEQARLDFSPVALQ
jgi:hypothetical protein